MNAVAPILKRNDDLGMDEAFTRDPIFEASVRGLVRWFGIKTVIETGTWRGYTARKMAEFVDMVHTIEAHPVTAALARETLAGVENAVVHEGDSGKLLEGIAVRPEAPILFFLDAHWQEQWPLFEELDGIAEYGEPCVIVIHDCQVPGKDFGFDTYDGKALTFELVKPYLDRLRFKWRHYFNTEVAAGSHRRGVLFVVPE